MAKGKKPVCGFFGLPKDKTFGEPGFFVEWQAKLFHRKGVRGEGSMSLWRIVRCDSP